MTEPHLSLDALADLLAGEGSDADVAHVGQCAGCSGRLDELAAAEVEVAAVLASLPAPRVPDDLADRLQAAFDGEPPLVAAPAVAAAAPLGDGRRTGGTVTPFPQARSRSRRSWLPAAAAVALVVSGGALGTALVLSGAGGGDENADTAGVAAGDAGGGTDDVGDLTRNATGTDYAAEGSLAAALPSLLSGSATPFTAPLSESQTSGRTAESADAPAGASSSGQPPDQPAAALTDEQRAAQAAAPPVAPELERLRTPEGLASCLVALLPPEEPDLRPLAVDYAAYAGSPALVVLLPATGAPDKVDAYVVGPDCAADDAQLLLFTRLDRA